MTIEIERRNAIKLFDYSNDLNRRHGGTGPTCTLFHAFLMALHSECDTQETYDDLLKDFYELAKEVVVE